MDTNKYFRSAHEKLDWGSATVLWDICRYKVVGLPLLDMYQYMAKDKELKIIIDYGINHILLPHTRKIQDLFQKEGLTAPILQPRKNQKKLSHLEPNVLMIDELIARSMREMIRFGVELSARGLHEVTRNDVKELIWHILTEDYKAFNKLTDLKEKKNWILAPPSV